MRVNMNKTKVVTYVENVWKKVMQKTDCKMAMVVCGRGVGCNSVQCTNMSADMSAAIVPVS